MTEYVIKWILGAVLGGVVTFMAEGQEYNRSESYFTVYNSMATLKKIIPANSTTPRTFHICVKSSDTAPDGYVTVRGTQHACFTAKEING